VKDVRRVRSGESARPLVVALSAAVFVTFATETLIMLEVGDLTVSSTLGQALFDAALLSIVVLPLLYALAFRPLFRRIARGERAEQALRENEDRYRDLVENSHDLICTHDLEGRILSANAAAARTMGLPHEAASTLNIADLLLP